MLTSPHIHRHRPHSRYSKRIAPFGYHRQHLVAEFLCADRSGIRVGALHVDQGRDAGGDVGGVIVIVAAIFARQAAEVEMGEANEPETLPWWWSKWPLAEVGLPVREWVRRAR